MNRIVHASEVVGMVEQAITKAARGLPDIGEVCRRAHRDSDDGLGSSMGGEAVGGTRVVDRATAERALTQIAKPDRVRMMATQMADAAYAMNHAADLFWFAVLALKAMDPKAVALELGDIPAQCLCCGRDVWGGAADRIKTGRCVECYDVHYRTGQNCSTELHVRRERIKKERMKVDPTSNQPVESAVS